MVCVHCGSKTQVTNSRLQSRINQVWRRRSCLECGAVFTTAESPHYGTAWAVKRSSGALQPFSRDKLLLSIYKSCGHRKTALKDAQGLTDTVIRKIAMHHLAEGIIHASDITRVTHVALNRFDKAASTHYQAFHLS